MHDVVKRRSEAAEIGDLYVRARTSIVNSVNYLIECGIKLKAKKKELDYGAWLPWLKENETILGFGISTAGRLIKAADSASTRNLKEVDAVRLSRDIWGNNKLAVHHSSEDETWETPQDLFDELDKEFGFQLDVCAEKKTAKCKKYFTKKDDGLSQKWRGVCWMNPPYGDVIELWMQKAKESADKGAIVVCLVPARVDTNWWWDNCIGGEIRFLKGRLKFGGAETSAPFPSAVVVLGRKSCVKWWRRVE